MTNIAGVFDSKKEADAAVSKLLDTGFTRDHLSLIVSDNARHTIFSAPTDDEGARALEGGVVGAVIGGVLGALVAGLTVVGVLVIPGAGGVLAVGPLVAALSGAGAGAAAGGLSGALINAGFAVDEAKRYEEEIRHGKAVIVVHTTDDMAEAARVALRSGHGKIKAA